MGGMKVDAARRIKELEAENAQLKKLLVKAALSMAGVVAVITQKDVPGNPRFGQVEQEGGVGQGHAQGVGRRKW